MHDANGNYSTPTPDDFDWPMWMVVTLIVMTAAVAILKVIYS